MQMLLGTMQNIEHRDEAEPAEATFDAADEKVIEEIIAQFSKGKSDDR
jgi:hypothetical protein